MGMRWLLLCVAFVCSTAFADSAKRLERRKKIAKQKIANGLALADHVLAQAIQRTEDDAQREMFALMQRRLHEVELIPPPEGEEHEHCETNESMMAFTNTETEAIYICRSLLTHWLFKTPEYAQILIHEATHKSGVHDECAATTLEVAAMNLSEIGLRFRNDYWQACGL